MERILTKNEIKKEIIEMIEKETIYLGMNSYGEDDIYFHGHAKSSPINEMGAIYINAIENKRLLIHGRGIYKHINCELLLKNRLAEKLVKIIKRDMEEFIFEENGELYYNDSYQSIDFKYIQKDLDNFYKIK